MHQSSYDQMRNLIATHIKDWPPFVALDVGSMNLNGSYRELLPTNCKYIGLDLEAGRGVDLVVSSPYHWSELEDSSIDLVMSGQAFEHIKFFWLTMQEIHRVLKPNGLCFLIAPSSGPVHSYPVDCWRFYADGMRALAEYVDMDVLDAGTNQHAHTWKDSYLVCRKKPSIKE